MNTTEHLTRRLKEGNLSPELRKALEHALTTQAGYHGFYPGQRVIKKMALSDNKEVTIVTWDDFFKDWPAYNKDMVEAREWVPFRHNDKAKTNAVIWTALEAL